MRIRAPASQCELNGVRFTDQDRTARYQPFDQIRRLRSDAASQGRGTASARLALNVYKVLYRHRHAIDWPARLSFNVPPTRRGRCFHGFARKNFGVGMEFRVQRGDPR